MVVLLPVFRIHDVLVRIQMQIRILGWLLLFSSVTFKTPTKIFFSEGTFTQFFGNMIRVVHPGSGSWFFTHPGSRGTKGTGSRIQRSKRHQIPDLGVKKAPDPGSRGQKGAGFRTQGGQTGTGYGIPGSKRQWIPDPQHWLVTCFQMLVVLPLLVPVPEVSGHLLLHLLLTLTQARQHSLLLHREQQASHSFRNNNILNIKDLAATCRSFFYQFALLL